MRPSLSTLALAVAAISLPSLVSAQGLPPGTWSGTITDPQGNTKPVTYKVTGAGDSLSITLSGPDGQAVSFTSLQLVADTLSFTWAGGRQGAPLVCQLLRQENGAFEGKCHDPTGQEGRMAMVPPPKE
jgi:hypothetical protein